MMNTPLETGGSINRMMKSVQFVSVGMRYGWNLMDMVARQRGYRAAAILGSKFAVTEIGKVPRIIHRTLEQKGKPGTRSENPVLYSPQLVARVSALPISVQSFCINSEDFRSHVAQCNYPKNYAAGPIEQGGLRDKKLLEYFVSLVLLDVQRADTVIDVASEWSIFPDVLRKLTGATVYQQDLIYPSGIHGQCIGGSAAHMPIADSFADKLVLHNAFEHFEGSADTEFILEAWRVLRPGGVLCILPLYLSEEYHILTDPLVRRSGVVWDEGARIVERPWWHNRFGRFYDPPALDRRVLAQARNLGFQTTVYHAENITEVLAQSDLHFVLMLRKPRSVGR